MWEAALVAALAVAAALWFLVLRLARAPLHPERGAFGVGVETQKEASSKADVPSSRLSVKPRSAAGGAASSGAESEGLSREGEPAAANSPAVPLLSAESDACEEGLAEEEPVVGNGAASKDESPVQPETKNLVARTSETSSADEVSATEEMVGDAKAADESFKDFVASPQPDECSVSSQHSPRGASSKPQEENLPHACSEHGEMEADEEGEALSSRPPPLPPAESDAASSNAEGVGQTSAEAQLPACASSAEEHAIPQVREAAFDNSQGSPSEKPAIFEGRNGEAPLSACVAGLGEVTAVGEVISETEEVAKAKVHCRSPREKVEKSAESHTFNKAEAAASVSPPEEEGSLPRFELLDSEDDDGEEHKTPEDLKEEANDRFRCGSISAALRLYTAAIARADERVEELEDRLDALEKEAEEELLRQGGAADSPSAATERPGLPCEEGDSVAAHSGADEDSAGRRRGEAASGETDEGEHPAVRHLPQERREEYRDKLARLRATDELLAVLKSNRALCHLHYRSWEAAVSDGTDAIRCNPNYAKAYLRRFRAYEGLEKWHEALSDLNKAIELDASLESQLAADKRRVKAASEAQFEREKEEMLSKLKDLGNFVLGKVGLSLDNFQVQQDPQSGGYSIKFNQNPGSGS